MIVVMAGWIVLGALCAAALALVLAGALQVAGAQRAMNAKLKRLEANQRSTFDAARMNAALARISRDAEAAKDLFERARQAIATIGAAVRYAGIAVRIVKLLR